MMETKRNWVRWAAGSATISSSPLSLERSPRSGALNSQKDSRRSICLALRWVIGTSTDRDHVHSHIHVQLRECRDWGEKYHVSTRSYYQPNSGHLRPAQPGTACL